MENGALNNRYFSNGHCLALIYGTYLRIHRICFIIYLFGSKLLLIFTNTNIEQLCEQTSEPPERVRALSGISIHQEVQISYRTLTYVLAGSII